MSTAKNIDAAKKTTAKKMKVEKKSPAKNNSTAAKKTDTKKLATGKKITIKNNSVDAKKNPPNAKTETAKQVDNMRGYYKLHAAIYDITRWTFLFGREKILKLLPFSAQDRIEILEIGCGTGKNIQALCKKFPYAQFTAFEVSLHMLKVAKKKLQKYQDRVNFIDSPYSLGQQQTRKKFDAILFSYSLTMINPQYAELIAQAKNDLKNGGVIAVVDFHTTPSKLYRRYMILNHVKMEAHLLPVLEKLFATEHKEVKKGYLGIWQYFTYVGKK